MTAKEIVAKLKTVKPIQAAGLKVMNLLDQRDVTNEAVIECLKDDPAFTARVLQACNSPQFGFRGSIVSIDQAVLVLGHEQIMRIVLVLSLCGTMTVPMEAYAFGARELWRHSLTTAGVAEILAKESLVAAMDPAAAFAAGLLHDIGKLAFAEVLAPEMIAGVRREITEHGLSRIEAEKAILGADHAEVGACLLTDWGIPYQIIEAVANHHKPILTPKLRLSALVCVADTLVHLSGSAPGWAAYAIKMDTGLVDALDLTTEKVEVFMIAARDSFVGVEPFMDLEVA